LEALDERPCTLEELRGYLKRAGYSPRLNVLRHRYVTPLADASLLEERAGVFTLTRKGKSIYALITTTDIAKLPLPSQGSDEKLLKALLAGPQTAEALRDVVPYGALRQSLQRLQKRKLLDTPTLTGRVFYYATKKRPTRKLSPTELKVFKALPPEGLSAKDLRDRVGISLRRVYTYLTRLKYKRHVRKEAKAAVYRLTEAGQRVAQAITLTSSLIAV
jgi:predicted transcriptional regulator